MRLSRRDVLRTAAVALRPHIGAAATDPPAAAALAPKEMSSKYKETSEGGLAVSVVLC